jgi:ATP-dependent Lhr-like helicase
MHTLVGHAPRRAGAGPHRQDAGHRHAAAAEPGRFSWGGHLGAQMQQPVVDEIARSSGTTLVFTNVRSQAEIWYQLLLQARPDWAGWWRCTTARWTRRARMGGSGLKAGTLKAVVATSRWTWAWTSCRWSGCCRSAAPRAWRGCCSAPAAAATQPGRPSRVTLVPTNTLELVEAAAARRAALAGQVESRTRPGKPLDVLVQHLVSVALGGGFEADALLPRCAAPTPTAR